MTQQELCDELRVVRRAIELDLKYPDDEPKEIAAIVEKFGDLIDRLSFAPSFEIAIKWPPR